MADCHLHFQDFKWFGEDGSLKRLPNPVRELPTRPAFVPEEELDPALQTVWGKVSVFALYLKVS